MTHEMLALSLGLVAMLAAADIAHGAPQCDTRDRVIALLADRYGQDFVDAFDLGAIDEQSKSPLWGPISLHPYAP